MASGTRYAILCGLNSNNIFTNIDNNDYFSTGDALGFLGTYRYTLADIQTGFGGNLNSLNISPIFASPTDYHISPITNPTLDNKGVYLPEVSVDFDGAIRANPPDIGAYEFSQALSVNDIKNDKSKLNVYPNPFSSSLKISDIKGLKSIIITDYSGRKIREFAPKYELSLNDIKSGGYLLIFQYENGDYKSVKIIKN